jgi:hypothetical protein
MRQTARNYVLEEVSSCDKCMHAQIVEIFEEREIGWIAEDGVESAFGRLGLSPREEEAEVEMRFGTPQLRCVSRPIERCVE